MAACTTAGESRSVLLGQHPVCFAKLANR